MTFMTMKIIAAVTLVTGAHAFGGATSDADDSSMGKMPPAVVLKCHYKGGVNGVDTCKNAKEVCTCGDGCDLGDTGTGKSCSTDMCNDKAFCGDDKDKDHDNKNHEARSTWEEGKYCPVRADFEARCKTTKTCDSPTPADFASICAEYHADPDSPCVKSIKSDLEQWMGYNSVCGTGLAGCDDTACTSTDGQDGFDCIAGTRDEACACSTGQARTTGLVIENDDYTLYGYTCCTGGVNQGEQCGDYKVSSCAKRIAWQGRCGLTNSCDAPLPDDVTIVCGEWSANDYKNDCFEEVEMVPDTYARYVAVCGEPKRR